MDAFNSAGYGPGADPVLGHAGTPRAALEAPPAWFAPLTFLQAAWERSAPCPRQLWLGQGAVTGLGGGLHQFSRYGRVWLLCFVLFFKHIWNSFIKKEDSPTEIPGLQECEHLFSVKCL